MGRGRTDLPASAPPFVGTGHSGLPIIYLFRSCFRVFWSTRRPNRIRKTAVCLACEKTDSSLFLSLPNSISSSYHRSCHSSYLLSLMLSFAFLFSQYVPELRLLYTHPRSRTVSDHPLFTHFQASTFSPRLLSLPRLAHRPVVCQLPHVFRHVLLLTSTQPSSPARFMTILSIPQVRPFPSDRSRPIRAYEMAKRVSVH